VRAIRPIAKGEQIFITYLNEFRTRSDRRTELLEKYSFHCTCVCCSLPELEVVRSDERRSSLNRIIKQTKDFLRDQDRLVKEWAADRQRPDDALIAPSQSVLDLMEKEGVFDQNTWFAHCAMLFKVNSALENLHAVQDLAKRAVTMAKVYIGSDGGWSGVYNVPKATEWWGLRKKASTG
jgi:hypothetical protein